LCLLSRGLLRHGVSIWIDVPLELAANDMLKSMGAQAISDPDSFSKVTLLSTLDYTILYMMLLFMLLKKQYLKYHICYCITERFVFCFHSPMFLKQQSS
jgi:hypothetical protein